jgi:branched-subunit amino acid ABC-type transport system permease component
MIELLVAQFFSGCSTASILFLVASGFTLIIGVLRVLNLAHGSFYLFAGFLSCSIAPITNFWVALMVVPILVALLGGVTEVVLFRRVYALREEYQILLSFALIYLFADLMKIIWRGRPYLAIRPAVLSGTVTIAQRPVPSYTLFTIGIAFLIGLLLWAYLYKTRLGNLTRAIEQDREASMTLGINVTKICTLTFVIAAWLAGIAGAVASFSRMMLLGVDAEVLISAFVVVVIGGMGSLAGSAIAALLVGMLTSYGILVMPQFASAFMFVLLAIVLLVRPWGLLGERL